MKSPLLKTMLVAVTTLFFFACSTGTNTESNDNAEDTAETAEVTEEATAPEISTFMTVWAEVEDYDAWKVEYDGVDHSAEKDGIIKMVVGRVDASPNNIFVGEIIADKEMAVAFLESEEMQANIEKFKVVGEPRINFLDVHILGDPVKDNLNRVMFNFKVKDHDTFMAYIENGPAEDEDNGVDLILLGSDQEDKNLIAMAFVLRDRALLEAYLESDLAKERMKEAGVEGDMEIQYVTLTHYDR